jgi:hypothetical protein
MSYELGFPKLVCKGVSDVRGDIIVVECSWPVVFGVLARVATLNEEQLVSNS